MMVMYKLPKTVEKTWINTVDNIPNLPQNTWVYHIEASVHDAGTAYAVFDGHTSGDMTPYVYKTTDFGTSWTSITTDEIKTFARNIQEDTKNPNLLFLGTEMGLYITSTIMEGNLGVNSLTIYPRLLSTT